MPFRIGSYRLWFWSAAALLLAAMPAPAQPPSPLELVRGLRENGHVDLALEYLKEIEGKPLSPDDKAAVGLERAKCLLDAAEEEADEGTRLGMVSEAKETLNAFLIGHPNHPRSVEALLASAKLTAADAKEQLNQARRMEIPPISDKPDEIAAREREQDKQKIEAKKARPMFLLAAKRFAEASAILRTRLDDKALAPLARRRFQRDAFDAQLASGVNQFNTAETYMPASRITGAEKKERDALLEGAKTVFDELAKGSPNERTTWVARAWAAEVTYERNDFNAAAAAVDAILRAGVFEAEDGKRLARFFRLRRNFIDALGERDLKKATASEKELRDWLRYYGNPRKPTPEVFAVRYYHARVLQSLAESSLGAPPKDGKPVVLTNTARTQFAEAERIFRGLAQTDNEYTGRASRQRMSVVRHLLGDAAQPPAAYESFEKAQMASLIQMSKLAAEEAKEKTDPDKVKAIRRAAIALLERARELATPQDNPADVTDVLLRLIFFYHLSDQPYEAAVLGEHVSHTIKGTGGKAALAGLLGLNGYVIASTRARGEDAAAARATDRAHAYALARYLDDKYPNDTATDTARHRLASMLLEDKQYAEAFDVLTRVRPGYAEITDVRLLEGWLATYLVNTKKDPLTDDKKAAVFKRAVADLAKVPKPTPAALEKEVRGYLSARCRLASLLFSQRTADPAAEAANPGYNQALAIATDVMAQIPGFDSMVKTAGGTKTLNVDGTEMSMLALDTYARAIYIRARALIDAADKLPPDQQAAKLAEAAAALEPTLAAVEKVGPAYNAEMKAWAEAGASGEPDAAQKVRVAQLASAVDRTRVDVILAGFRLKVKQGKAPEAAGLLDLMVKAGGTIEDNLPVLELLGREMAGQMAIYRREGKEKEAKELGAGLAVLLTKITAVPTLTPAMQLFIGYTLQAVGENDKAIETLQKVPVPEFAGWESKKPEDIPAELRGRLQDQIRDYALAQLTIARALRESKKFAEAEAKLQGIVGTNDKPGWGSGRLYFRRELATLFEDKGAAAPDARAANAEWGRALKEWTTLFGIQRYRLSNPPKDVDPDKMKQFRNSFADAYFDVQRCLVKANLQIFKGQPPEKLQKTFDSVGKGFADMEKQIPAGDWDPVVQNQYADFLKEVPQLLPPYKAAGGKAFLEKLPL